MSAKFRNPEGFEPREPSEAVVDLASRVERAAAQAVTRRQMLRLGGLVIGVAAVPPLLAACGSKKTPAAQTSTAAAPTVTVAAPTVVAPTTAPTTAGAVVNVKAHEAGEAFVFDVDKLAVPAGPVQFEFSNTGTMTHELWVYPLQDLTKMLTLKRKGEKAGEEDYIKGIVGSAEDIDPGKSATIKGTLKPGFYELACFMKSKRPDGTWFCHFDKGQSVVIAATGPGGPSDSVATPASTMALQMVPGEGELSESWLFVPDRLVVKSGDVTFKVANKMTDMKHDVALYPLGDITALIAQRLADKEDYSIVKGSVLMEDLEAGKSDEKPAKLTPGWWVAACFRVSTLADGTKYVHRDRGQRTTFLVQ